MKIEYKFSAEDITEVLNLLNEFLEHISLLTLSCTDKRYCDIVKKINRWGINDEEEKYYELLNGVIGKILSCNPMLQIYKPIELLLFRKLLEGLGKELKPEFAKEEIEIFFLQPYKMIRSSCISESGRYLYGLIMESRKLSVKLKSEDSKEFLDKGLVRRLFMLKATVDSISKIYCESRIKPLNDNENAILSLNTNFFYANIYAIVDCLALVFASEFPKFNINTHKKHDRKKAGLFNENFYTKIDGLSDELNLIKLKPWHEEIKDLRHPVAHSIPLYFPEIYNDEDARKIQEVDEKYSKSFNAILKNMTSPTSDISEQLRNLREKRQKAESKINVFSGCFLHSYEESEKFYHLSRLTLDLGILYYLSDKSFEYLCVLCG